MGSVARLSEVRAQSDSGRVVNPPESTCCQQQPARGEGTMFPSRRIEAFQRRFGGVDYINTSQRGS